MPGIVDVKDEGLTVLYEPTHGPILADVVFVHGLQGHPRKTWSTKGPVKEGKLPKSKASRVSRFLGKKDGEPKTELQHTFFWPAQLLPEDHQDLRVLTYGYDSHVSRYFRGPANKDNISQHGRALLNALVRSRSGCPTRPLILVAHSLGGIIVKEALIEGEKQGEYVPEQDISAVCPAIVFFGTPHRGADDSAWGLMLSNIVRAAQFDTNTNILTDLDPSRGSSKLQDLERDFAPFLKKIKIYTFQESAGKLGFAPAGGKVVMDQSSAFNNREFEYLDTINANHMNMCRFESRDDDGYEKFDGALKRILRNLEKKQEENARENKAAEMERKQFMSEENDNYQQEILRSLDFAERTARESRLKSADPQTLAWLWRIEPGSAASFSDWLVNNQHIFWIQGKPGSGKSTLMKHLYHDPRTLDLLQGKGDRAWITVPFFFDYSGHRGITNNFEGLLRSILRGLIEHCPDETGGNRRTGSLGRRHNTMFTWDEETLQKHLRERITRCPRNICLFVDGLDEYEGDMGDLVRFFRTLSSGEGDTLCFVKVCLASRPEPMINQMLKDYPGLRMDIHNWDGIGRYVSIMLNSIEPSTADLALLQDLSEDIANRAEGVFLWARIAVRELIQGYVEGDGLDEVEHRLAKLPPELESLYSTILQRMTEEGRKTALVMLQLVSSAKRDLHLQELVVATDIAMGKRTIYGTSPEHGRISTFRKRIQARTGGLVDIIDHEAVPPMKRRRTTVKLIHETVRSYADRAGAIEFRQQSMRPYDNSAALWLDVCCKQIRVVMKDHPQINAFDARNDPSLESLEDLCERFSLLSYASDFVFEHARDMELELDISSYPFLQTIMSPALCLLHDSCLLCDRCLSRGAENWPWMLTISHGLMLCSKDALAEGKFIDTPAGEAISSTLDFDEWELHSDIDGSYPDHVLSMLENGAVVTNSNIANCLQHRSAYHLKKVLNYCHPRRLNIHSQSKSGNEFGPLWLLLSGQGKPCLDFEEKLDYLVERGEDLYAPCGPGGTILHAAISEERFGAAAQYVAKLIARGCDPNADGPWGTPLQLAWKRARSGGISSHVRSSLQLAIKVLIQSGAVADWHATDEDVPTLESILAWCDTDQAVHGHSIDSGPASIASWQLNYRWVQQNFDHITSTTFLSPVISMGFCYGPHERITTYGDKNHFKRIGSFLTSYEHACSVNFYVRESDHLAIIQCESPRHARSSKSCYLPLNALRATVRRRFIILTRQTTAWDETAWARLSFNTLEDRVIFHCTFLSLQTPTSTTSQELLPGEYRGSSSWFAGLAICDGHRIAIRVYYDKKIASVLLEASNYERKRRNVPVWTSIITQNLQSPDWFPERIGDHEVVLRNIHWYVFTNEPLCPTTEDGHSVIFFKLQKDADDFVATLRDLRDAICPSTSQTCDAGVNR